MLKWLRAVISLASSSKSKSVMLPECNYPSRPHNDNFSTSFTFLAKFTKANPFNLLQSRHKDLSCLIYAMSGRQPSVMEVLPRLRLLKFVVLGICLTTSLSTHLFPSE